MNDGELLELVGRRTVAAEAMRDALHAISDDEERERMRVSLSAYVNLTGEIHEASAQMIQNLQEQLEEFRNG